MGRKDKKAVWLSMLVIPVFFSGVFAVSFSPCREAAPPQITLEFWSVFDDSDVYTPLLAQMKADYPNISINYFKKDVTIYEKELIDALAAGKGPDIFAIHNTWLPKHKDKLAEAPTTMIDEKRFKEVFVDVAAQDLINEGKIYGFPVAVDNLALFYNTDLFNSAGLSGPPATWSDFNNDVEKLTRRDASGNILQAGAAIGTARNINRSTDLLGVLMLQGGTKMIDDAKAEATFDRMVSSANQEVFNPGLQGLRYFTGFANRNNSKIYTWNSQQNYSLDAFVEGKAAMMFNYSYQIPQLRARAPHLNFAVVPLPQISANSKKVTYANYWPLAVSKTSKNQTHAWQVLGWLVKQENLKTYLDATKKPAARRDLIDGQKSDSDLGIFAEQALFAQCWWQADNIAVEQIFADMIESVTNGSATAEEALQRGNQQTTLLMSKTNP